MYVSFAGRVGDQLRCDRDAVGPDEKFALEANREAAQASDRQHKHNNVRHASNSDSARQTATTPSRCGATSASMSPRSRGAVSPRTARTSPFGSSSRCGACPDPSKSSRTTRSLRSSGAFGGTQTGSYQTGSYQKGRFILPKLTLLYFVFLIRPRLYASEA